MKSLKDALTLYRTLAAEALSEFSYSERGESLGRHLDDAAWRLSRKIRPSRKPTDTSEAWQNVGYLSDEGIDFGALIERVEQDSAEMARRYLEGVAAHLYVGPTSGDTVGALFKPSEDWAARQAQEMHAAIAPALKKLAGGDEGPWAVSAIREAFAFPQVTLPSFVDFNPDGIEPWQERVQDSVNEMTTRIARAQDDMMRGTITETFIAGVDPESEWTKVSRALIEGFESKDVGEDQVGDWILGIPIYDDPDDPAMMRMKTADLMAAPNGPKIIETVFGVSDPDGSVEDNPTT